MTVVNMLAKRDVLKFAERQLGESLEENVGTGCRRRVGGRRRILAIVDHSLEHQKVQELDRVRSTALQTTTPKFSEKIGE